MKIIAGLIESDSGKISQSRFTTTGYLPQDGVYHSGTCLFDEVSGAFDELNRLHERIENISDKIAAASSVNPDKPSLQKLLRELEEAQHIVEAKEGYNTETRIKKVLFGLGFTEGDLKRGTQEFSGGWHMRIEIAKLLLREPSVLLLDEPTNHLDMESLEWIEDYLQSYSGSLLLVSHDSRFLDTLVNRVIEISMGTVSEYTGNYSSYLEQKIERHEILHSTYENQQKFIRRTSRFIERFRYKNTKARQVKSRVKQLEKMERISIEKDEKTITFGFQEPPRAGRVMMKLGSISKSYGNNPIFTDISLQIERGDRIALLGVNGSGKSTLARIIAGTEPFQDGTRTPGHNIAISYYAQNMAEELDNQKTVLRTLDDAAPLTSPEELRTLLGCFLFTEDDVFKPVSVLSGGEKSRLALAKMLLKPANLLIMDEPTNHLDIKSKAILQESLNSYNGAYLIVSHDRDFLAPLIDKVLVLKDGQMTLYYGNVDKYLEKYHKEEKDPEDGDNEKREAPSYIEKDRRRREAEKRQERYQRLKPLRDTLDKIERDIEAAEKKKADMEAAFADQETYKDESLIQSLNLEYRETHSLLESLYEKWTETEEKIEETLNDYRDMNLN
jgi:ATP-binding cassette subfamily F protein 3